LKKLESITPDVENSNLFQESKKESQQVLKDVVEKFEKNSDPQMVFF